MGRLNNEGVTKATLNILENLKETENLKVTKRVLSEGYGKATIQVASSNAKKKGNKRKLKEAEEPIEDILDTEVDVDLDAGAEDIEDARPNETALLGELDAGKLDCNLLAKALLKNMSDEEIEEFVASEDYAACEVKEDEEDEEAEDVEDIEDVETAEEPEVAPEDLIVEGLEIVNIKGNTVLLKESNRYIVGKNYDKSTGIIEEASTYKTEKVANKAFDKLSKLSK